MISNQILIYVLFRVLIYQLRIIKDAEKRPMLQLRLLSNKEVFHIDVIKRGQGDNFYFI